MKKIVVKFGGSSLASAAQFEKVGSIGLMAAVILLLAGILLLVIRKNKAAAEAPSMMEM